MSKKNKWSDYRSRIPFKVHAGRGLYYEIVFVDGFDNPDILGETRYDKKQIALKTGLTDKQTVELYLHEITHLLSYSCDAGLTENQVLAFEKTYHYILKEDNIFKRKTNGKKTKTK